MVENRVYITRWRHTTSTSCDVKAETHDATYRGDKSPRLHCCCNKSLALSLSLRYVARIQTSLNLCDRQNSVAATMSFTCHTRRFVAATCRSDVSRGFVASCVSALMIARAKIIYILMTKVIKLFSFFSSRCFLKGIENMYSVFLAGYTNTHESLGDLEKAV